MPHMRHTPQVYSLKNMRTGLTGEARIVLKLLPLILIPALAAAVAYWLTRSRGVAAVAGGVVLGAMLFIGITS